VLLLLLPLFLQALLLNGVFFSAPQVGDATFASTYDQLVNSRDVDFTSDVISDMPCAPTSPGCPAKPSGLLGTVSMGSMRALRPASWGCIAPAACWRWVWEWMHIWQQAAC